MTRADAAKAHNTYIELCALCPTEADRVLLSLPKYPAIHALSPIGIAGTVIVRAAVTRTVFVDDDGDGETDTGWETHGGGGSFGASVAAASSRTPATREEIIEPATYGASVPRVVAEIGYYDLRVAAWMLVVFGAAEIVAMRGLLDGDTFVRRILDTYRERPQYVLQPVV